MLARPLLARAAAFAYDCPDTGESCFLAGSQVGAFGEKFRKERERRGFSFDDVANVTKIGSRMLKAIEEERFDRLPGGVFNKGFIRTYAKHLGLNDEEAITEYLEALRQAQVEAQNALSPAPSAQTRSAPEAKANNSKAAGTARRSGTVSSSQHRVSSGAGLKDGEGELPHLQLPKAEHIRPRHLMRGSDRTSISWTVPALVGLLVVAGIFLWNRHSRSTPAAGGTNAAPPSVAASSAASSAVPPPADESAAKPAPPAPTTPVPVPAAGPAAGPAVDAADENDVTQQNLKPLRPAGTTPQAAPALTLVIRAAENSWISVMADGQHLTQETLIAPAHTSVRASREIVVKAGNAAGVSFLLNGKEIPPQGVEGEVKTLVFDSTGLRAPTPAPPAPTPDPVP